MITVSHIRELKAEHGSGSENAFRHLKIWDEYQTLRDLVVADLQAAHIDYRPTVREIANVAEEIGETANDALRERGADFYEIMPEGKNYVSGHVVLPAHETEINRGDQKLWKVLYQHRWGIRYRPLLVTYCRGRAEGKDYSEAREDLKAELLSAENRYFLHERKQPMSFTEIASDVDLLTDWEEKPTSESRDADPQGDRWDMSILNTFFLEGELVKGTSYALNRIGFADSDIPVPPTEKPTSEELALLYEEAGGLYERAKSERTLHRMETERRIALATMISAVAHGQPKPETGPWERIEWVIDASHTNLRVLRAQQENLTAQGGFSIYPETIAQLEYTLHTIQENRAWLARMLAH